MTAREFVWAFLQHDWEFATHTGQRRPGPLAFEHGDLLPESENFQGGIGATAEERANGCQDCNQEIEHD